MVRGEERKTLVVCETKRPTDYEEGVFSLSEERPKSMDHELYNNKPQTRGVRAIMVATGCEWSQKDTRCTVAQCGSGQSAVDDGYRERRRETRPLSHYVLWN